MPQIRVLVVDDSAAVRQALTEVINSDPALSVMGTAADPVRAVKLIREEKPDLITLDVEMPEMDGVTFLKRIMLQHPIPVVMCSTLLEENSETLVESLAAGAIDVIKKPKLGTRDFFEESQAAICETLKAAARAKPRARSAGHTPEKKLTADEVLAPPSSKPMAKTTEHVVAVGSSTGGTEAIATFLQALPADCPPIIIVQHMPGDFTKSFADRLDKMCDVTVAEAKTGDRLLRGHALIAPGGIHTLVGRRGAQYDIELRDGPLVSRHKPSVDVMFRSVARAAGPNAIGVILTGMGDDGARGLLEMREAGAKTIGQDEATSVVYGMPKAAFDAGAVEAQLPLDKIPRRII